MWGCSKLKNGVLELAWQSAVQGAPSLHDRAISAILVQISDTECANRSEKTIPAILKDAIHFGNTAVVVTYLHLHWENACA